MQKFGSEFETNEWRPRRENIYTHLSIYSHDLLFPFFFFYYFLFCDTKFRSLSNSAAVKFFISSSHSLYNAPGYVLWIHIALYVYTWIWNTYTYVKVQRRNGKLIDPVASTHTRSSNWEGANKTNLILHLKKLIGVENNLISYLYFIQLKINLFNSLSILIEY